MQTLKRYLWWLFVVILLVIITIVSTLLVITITDSNRNNQLLKDAQSQLTTVQTELASCKETSTCKPEDEVITKFSHPSFNTAVELPGVWEVKINSNIEDTGLYMTSEIGAQQNYGALITGYNLSFVQGTSEISTTLSFGPFGSVGAPLENAVKISEDVAREFNQTTNKWSYYGAIFNIVDCISDRKTGGTQTCQTGSLGFAGFAGAASNLQVKAATEADLLELDKIILELIK